MTTIKEFLANNPDRKNTATLLSLFNLALKIKKEKSGAKQPDLQELEDVNTTESVVMNHCETMETNTANHEDLPADL